MTLPPPTPYVQWRRPGEEKWNDYDPWTLPWDSETLEMRLLPRPLFQIPPDSVVIQMDHDGPSEYRVSNTREHTVRELEEHLVLALPTLRAGTYEITVTVEKMS